LAAATAAHAGKKADEKQEQNFFGPEKLYTIHLHVTAADWDLLQPARRPRPATLVADSIPAPATRPASAPAHPAHDAPDKPEKGPAYDGETLPPNNFGYEYVYVKAAFECDGEKLGDVAIRFKGNSSYQNYGRWIKRPYKVDFDRFVKGRKFHGLQTLNLSNNAFDAWQLREALAYEVYRRAGVPTPRTAFALLYLTVDGEYDRQFVGFYTLVEELDDKAFLKSHFGDAGGILLKPEGIRGLPYMGENWQAYPQRYHAKNAHRDPALERRFIDFVKLVNYADDKTFDARIGDYLAIDPLLRYLAATVLITNLDSPLVTNHNFYLYENPADQKVWIMPWDMNLSFASYGTGRDNAFDLSVSHPWVDDNKLLERLMAIPENEKAYRAYLRQFVKEFFNPESMKKIEAPMKQALAKADGAAVAAKMPKMSGQGTPGRFGGRSYTLDDYVPKRVESVLAQLDGKDVPTYTPHQNHVNMGFQWGLKTPAEYGSLPLMAQGIRLVGDDDGDYLLSGREAREAAASLFYTATTRASQDSITEADLAAALAPLMRDVRGAAPNGLMSFIRGKPSAAGLWAEAVLHAADTDRDHRLTLPELATLAERLLCESDRDQDSRLDEREIIEALDALATPGAAAERAPEPTKRRR
jgi:spore coat protein CotH